jgi:hypothetical protein
MITQEMVTMARRLIEAHSLELGHPLNLDEIRNLLQDEALVDAWRAAGMRNASSNMMMWDEPPEVPCVDGTERHVWVVSDENENVCYCERCGCPEY